MSRRPLVERQHIAEGLIALELELHQIVPQLTALADAGEDRQLPMRLAARRRGPFPPSPLGALRQPSETRLPCLGRGLRADQVGEAVVPEAADVEPGRGAGSLLGDAADHLQHAVDVVVIDMAEHGQVDRQRRGVAAELFEPRLQEILPDAGRPAVDDPQALLPTMLVAQQQGVAELRMHGLEDDHRPPPTPIAARAGCRACPRPGIGLAAEIGRRPAEHLLDPLRMPDQLAVPRHQQRRRAADVRGGHAGAVHALGAAIGDRRRHLLPGATRSGLRRPSPVGPRLEK